MKAISKEDSIASEAGEFLGSLIGGAFDLTIGIASGAAGALTATVANTSTIANNSYSAVEQAIDSTTAALNEEKAIHALGTTMEQLNLCTEEELSQLRTINEKFINMVLLRRKQEQEQKTDYDTRKNELLARLAELEIAKDKLC